MILNPKLLLERPVEKGQRKVNSDKLGNITENKEKYGKTGKNLVFL